jgi:hypothetical protein
MDAIANATSVREISGSAASVVSPVCHGRIKPCDWPWGYRVRIRIPATDGMSLLAYSRLTRDVNSVFHRLLRVAAVVSLNDTLKLQNINIE